jgi:hypothetical protein
MTIPRYGRFRFGALQVTVSRLGGSTSVGGRRVRLVARRDGLVEVGAADPAGLRHRPVLVFPGHASVALRPRIVGDRRSSGGRS